MSKEFEIIEQIFRRRAHSSPDVALGIGDDAALTHVQEGCDLVTATDALVAGTHFLVNAPAASVGHRCLAVNLSDIAAMGAEPLWASLALSVPHADREWLNAFADGFFNLADKYRVSLIGGDTVRGSLFAAVTLQGIVPHGQAITRSGAAPGDLIYVTGHVGDAAAGRLLASDELGAAAATVGADVLTKRFCFPEPRIAAGQSLRGLASAMIDISDGLHTDLGRLLQASGTGAVLNVNDIPVSDALEAATDRNRAFELALHGGEDYELCFTIAPERVSDLHVVADSWDCGLSCVGTVAAQSAVAWFLDGERYGVAESGFEHFE